MPAKDKNTSGFPSFSFRLDVNKGPNWAYPLGFWSSVVATGGGAIYFLVILGAILSGNFAFPPSSFLQVFGGISSLVLCPVLVVVMASLHTITPSEKKGFSQVSLGFTLLFAIAVSINRFTQLGVVQQSLAQGSIEGIGWFLPYGERSVMFGLEMMGWGWFLGLALLAAAPLFARGRLQLWLRGLMLLYAALALASALAFLLGSSLAAIGFAAWGLVLFIITALLAVYFRRAEYSAA